MEDDAVPLTADLHFFLDPATLNSLPQFDVLRMVSDPARWKRPAWKVAQIHGRGIFAMARPGWGLQGQIYSRSGLQKMSYQLGAISAPVAVLDWLAPSSAKQLLGSLLTGAAMAVNVLPCSFHPFQIVG